MTKLLRSDTTSLFYPQAEVCGVRVQSHGGAGRRPGRQGERGVRRRSRRLLPITRWIVYPSQIRLDSKTPVLIVLWKDAHAVGMFSVKAVLAMIEGLALKVIGLANIYTGMRSAASGICLPLSDNEHRCNRFESSVTEYAAKA